MIDDFIMENAAYAAAAWASGESQKSLAQTFGYKTSAPVCRAIGRFLDEFSGVRVTYSTGMRWGLFTERIGETRKALVPQALRNYLASRATEVVVS